MKTVILALLVMVVISHGEALRCYCGGTNRCPGSVETCYGSNNVCANVIIYAGSWPSYFQGCMASDECRRMNQPGISSASCCHWDLCIL